MPLGNPPAAFSPTQEMASTSPKEKGRAQDWAEVVSDLPVRLPHGQCWEGPSSRGTTSTLAPLSVSRVPGRAWEMPWVWLWAVNG